MKNVGSYLYLDSSYAQSLISQARSQEILRVAKEMADKQHAEVVKKLEVAPISPSTRNRILRSLKSHTK